MKALVKAKPERGIWLEQRPVPQIGPDDILVRVRRTGICGTDVHIFNWDEWASRTVPVAMITGHEFAGEIVELGKNVSHLNIGQRVSGEGHLVGGNGRASRSGKYHLDPEARGIGVNVPGAFAEFLSIPAFNAIPLPDAVDDELGALLDPLGNAVHTALSFNLVGEDVLITGAGPIGIMTGAVARHAGARHVVITDVNSQRLDLAAKVADVVPVDVSRRDLKSEMDRLGIREGFDVGLEMSGSSAALEQMIDHLVMGGRIALLGIPPRSFEFDLSKIVFRMITLKGIYGREMFETWHTMLAMLETGLKVKGVITDRFAAEQYADAFGRACSGDAGKVVMDWT